MQPNEVSSCAADSPLRVCLSILLKLHCTVCIAENSTSRTHSHTVHVDTILRCTSCSGELGTRARDGAEVLQDPSQPTATPLTVKRSEIPAPSNLRPCPHIPGYTGSFLRYPALSASLPRQETKVFMFRWTSCFGGCIRVRIWDGIRVSVVRILKLLLNEYHWIKLDELSVILSLQ